MTGTVAGARSCWPASWSSTGMEQRRGAALVVDAAAIEVEAPSEDALTAYLAANAKTYEAPEYRSVTLLTLAPEDLLAEIEVSDADIRAAYDARIDLLPHAGAAPVRAAAGTGRGDDQARGRARRRRAELHPGGRGAEGRQGRALGARPAGQGRPAGGARPGRLRAGPGRGERAGADAVRLASAAAARDRARAGRSRSRRSRTSCARELRLRASRQPAARFRHQARRRAGRRHAARRRGREAGIELLKLERIDRTGHTRRARSGSPPTG